MNFDNIKKLEKGVQKKMSEITTFIGMLNAAKDNAVNMIEEIDARQVRLNAARKGCNDIIKFVDKLQK